MSKNQYFSTTAIYKNIYTKAVNAIKNRNFEWLEEQIKTDERIINTPCTRSGVPKDSIHESLIYNAIRHYTKENTDEGADSRKIFTYLLKNTTKIDLDVLRLAVEKKLDDVIYKLLEKYENIPDPKSIVIQISYNNTYKDNNGKNKKPEEVDQTIFIKLLKHGMNINGVDDKGFSVLDRSLISGNKLAIQTLKEHKANIDQSLCTGIEKENFSLAKSAIQFGANINSSISGKSLVNIANEKNNITLFKLLIQHGGKLDISTNIENIFNKLGFGPILKISMYIEQLFHKGEIDIKESFTEIMQMVFNSEQARGKNGQDILKEYSNSIVSKIQSLLKSQLTQNLFKEKHKTLEMLSKKIANRDDQQVSAKNNLITADEKYTTEQTIYNLKNNELFDSKGIKLTDKNGSEYFINFFDLISQNSSFGIYINSDSLKSKAIKQSVINVAVAREMRKTNQIENVAFKSKALTVQDGIRDEMNIWLKLIGESEVDYQSLISINDDINFLANLSYENSGEVHNKIVGDII